MRKWLVALLISAASIPVFAVCNFPRPGRVVPVRGASNPFGDQVMYECTASGARQSGGNHVCVQYIGQVYTGSYLRTDNDRRHLLHGAVFVLQKSDGEVASVRPLYVGDPSRKPANAVNYVGTSTSRTQLIAQMCEAQPPSEHSRVHCMCSENPGPSCRGRDAFTFDLQSQGVRLTNNGFLVGTSRRGANVVYTPLSNNYRNRLQDSINGLVPVYYCPRAASDGRAARLATWARGTATQAARNQCFDDLQTSSPNLAAINSAVYNPGSSVSTGGMSFFGLGGTFAEATKVVNGARRAMGINGCYPTRPTQRAEYDSQVEGRRQRRSNR